MISFTEQQIKEIAEELDLGFCCYYHKETGELVFLPDEMQFGGMDLEAFEEDEKKLKRDRKNYEEISPPRSFEGFKIMKDFACQLDENKALQEELFAALQRKSPFANFKAILDKSGEYRDKWFAFKQDWLMNWVRRQII